MSVPLTLGKYSMSFYFLSTFYLACYLPGKARMIVSTGEKWMGTDFASDFLLQSWNQFELIGS